MIAFKVVKEDLTSAMVTDKHRRHYGINIEVQFSDTPGLAFRTADAAQKYRQQISDHKHLRVYRALVIPGKEFQGSWLNLDGSLEEEVRSFVPAFCWLANTVFCDSILLLEEIEC